jgi:hypothetical protein
MPEALAIVLHRQLVWMTKGVGALKRRRACPKLLGLLTPQSIADNGMRSPRLAMIDAVIAAAWDAPPKSAALLPPGIV